MKYGSRKFREEITINNVLEEVLTPPFHANPVTRQQQPGPFHSITQRHPSANSQRRVFSRSRKANKRAPLIYATLAN